MARIRVNVRDPEGMHIAGLMLARLLERAALSGGAELPLRGNVVIDADGMRTTLVPGAGGEIEVVAGEAPPVRAEVRAPLQTLLDLAGGGSTVRAAFFGGLRARGSLRALLGLRAILNGAMNPAAEHPPT